MNTTSVGHIVCKEMVHKGGVGYTKPFLDLWDEHMYFAWTHTYWSPLWVIGNSVEESLT